MKILPLTWSDAGAWAALLAAAFARPVHEMVALLRWLHRGPGLLAWGAWDGARLAGQYSCLPVGLALPGGERCQAGLSVNLAVHPEYRGRGLVRPMAEPVYAALAGLGAVAGVGFSNAAGVAVDRRSQGYGYQVVGQLRPVLGWLGRPLAADPLELTTDWPAGPWCPPAPGDHVHVAAGPELLAHRFARHPFRRYRFGVWRSASCVRGVIVYRPLARGPLPGAALLAAYGSDLPELVARWAAALRQQGGGFVQALTSPAAPLRAALAAAAYCVTLPARTPYYLTVKPLAGQAPGALFDFARWDCQGGQVL